MIVNFSNIRRHDEPSGINVVCLSFGIYWAWRKSVEQNIKLLLPCPDMNNAADLCNTAFLQTEGDFLFKLKTTGYSVCIA